MLREKIKMLKLAFLALIASFAFVSAPAFADDNRATFKERQENAVRLIKGDGSCISCKVFGQFSSTIFEANETANNFGPKLVPILVSFAMLFSLFYLGGGLITGDGSDLISRWQVFYRLLLVVALVSWFLNSNPVQLMWSLFYNPLMLLGISIAEAVGVQLSASCTSIDPVWPDQANTTLTYMMRGVCTSQEMVIEHIATGMALGTTEDGDGFSSFFIYGFSGLVIVVLFGFLMIVFPLRFVDIIVRLAIVSILAPFFALAFAFKPTRGYSYIGIAIALNAAAQFALFMILLSIGSSVFDSMSSYLFVDAASDDTSASTVLVNALTMVAIASIFLGLIKAVPSIASELTKSSSGGGEGGAAGIKTVATPMMVGGSAAGLAVGLPARYAIRKTGAGVKYVGSAAYGKVRGVLGKGVS